MKTVKLTLNQVDWHVPPERPEKDGTYWAVSKWEYLTEWNFTTEGGWNTHRNRDGELCNENALPDDIIAAWTDKKPYTLEVCDV